MRSKLEEKEEKSFIAAGEPGSRPIEDRCPLEVDLVLGVDIYPIAQLLSCLNLSSERNNGEDPVTRISKSILRCGRLVL